MNRKNIILLILLSIGIGIYVFFNLVKPFQKEKLLTTPEPVNFILKDESSKDQPIEPTDLKQVFINGARIFYPLTWEYAEPDDTECAPDYRITCMTALGINGALAYKFFDPTLPKDEYNAIYVNPVNCANSVEGCPPMSKESYPNAKSYNVSTCLTIETPGKIESVTGVYNFIIKSIPNNFICNDPKEVGMRVVDSRTGFEIKNYELEINGEVTHGKTESLGYLSILPDKDYKYRVNAPGYKFLESNINLDFGRTDSTGNDKYVLNMEPLDSKEWSLNWINLNKEAEKLNKSLIIGYIATSDYKAFPGVEISSEESLQKTITDKNGYFAYYYNKDSVNKNTGCISMHIKKTGYKEIKTLQYEGGGIQFRMQPGEGVINEGGPNGCSEVLVPTGTGITEY